MIVSQENSGIVRKVNYLISHAVIFLQRECKRKNSSAPIRPVIDPDPAAMSLYDRFAEEQAKPIAFYCIKGLFRTIKAVEDPGEVGYLRNGVGYAKAGTMAVFIKGNLNLPVVRAVFYGIVCQSGAELGEHTTVSANTHTIGNGEKVTDLF